MKYIRLTVLVIGILVCTTPLFAATLGYKLCDWDGNQIPGAPGIQFNLIYDDASGQYVPLTQANQADLTTDPWVYSPQCLLIEYTTTTADNFSWGLRLYTDNEKDIGQVYPRTLDLGLDKKLGSPGAGPDITAYPYVAGVWQTGDDSITFAALIEQATKDVPEYRAEVAWQIYPDPVGGSPGSIPGSVIGGPIQIAKNMMYGWNVGVDPEEFNDPFKGTTWVYSNDWAPCIDMSNRLPGTVSGVTGVSAIEDIFWVKGDYTSGIKPDILISGYVTDSYLAQYPVISGTYENPGFKRGDGSVAVYFAACFGNYNDKTEEYDGTLPPGLYQTKFYLMMFTE